MAQRLKFLLPLLVFIAVGVYFAIGLNRDPKLIPSVLIDKPVPEFALPGLPGGEGLASSRFKGQVSVLNVFASWCVPCRIEHPVIARLARDYKVPVYGLNYKDKTDDAVAWLKRQGDPYAAIGVDADGRTGIDLGVYGVPETFIIDREGRIRHKHVGPLSADDLTRTVLPLIKELQG